jgi:predicted HicB family RNase H-like nuclease
VLQVRLSDREHTALRAAAEAEGVSMAEKVRRLAAGL